MTSRWRLWIGYIVACLPPFLVIITILSATIDIPFADQWELVPLLERSYTHSLTWYDLWSQHNEHRLIIPRLMMLFMARLSGWNTHVEMLSSVGWSSISLLALGFQLHQTERTITVNLRWLMPWLSLGIFSLNQAENWSGGWNLQILLNLMMAIITIILLTQPQRRRWQLVLASGSAWAASYSYSSGLLLWLIGGVILGIQYRHGWTTSRKPLVFWLGAAALTIGSFVYDYHRPPSDLPMPSLWTYINYSLTYLGAPLMRGSVEYGFGVLQHDPLAICNLSDSNLCRLVYDASRLAGLLSVGLFGWLIWRIHTILTLKPILVYLGLGMYPMITAILTSVGRAAYGPYQALAQRYASVGTLWWLVLLVLIVIAYQLPRRRQRLLPARLLIISIGGCFLLSTIQGRDHVGWQQRWLAPTPAALRTLDDDQLLARLYPQPAVVRERVVILQRYRLSVFRQP